MSTTERWLLPEGIDELLPHEAEQLESLRRQLIDRFNCWGYQLVFPPLVEYLDSLLTGTGKALELQTFKLTDQMSGRLLGIRADMTPQVARIAAHKLRDKEVLRLCYIGNVLHTLPEGQGRSRNPIQLGAEIYGHSGPESDMEVLQLMMEALAISQTADQVYLDLGHVGIYRGLARQADLNEQQEQDLFVALQRKALPEIEMLLTQFKLNSDSHAMLLALAELNGSVDVLEQAKKVLGAAPDDVHDALQTLKIMAAMVEKRLPEIPLHFDLAELRGYNYHTGLVFAAYRADSAQAVATGGRYDDIGEVFGRAQPATGFSLDLKNIVTQQLSEEKSSTAISVEWTDDDSLNEAVEELRSTGDVVSYHLPGTAVTEKRTLIKQHDCWVVVETGTETRG